MQPVEAFVAMGIGDTSGHHSENSSVRIVRSAVMTRVDRHRTWCVIGVGVSFGENSTLPARDAGSSTQVDGHWNALPEERLCNAHCDFRRAAEEAAGRCVKQRWAGGTSAQCTWMAPTLAHLCRMPKEKTVDLSGTDEKYSVFECRVGSADGLHVPRRCPLRCSAASQDLLEARAVPDHETARMWLRNCLGQPAQEIL
ncbi:hypothetical protein MTO96_038751 [Rhipicephalus appendiculatus]